MILLLALSCARRPSRLEQALTLAGDNRAELEKALNHYSADPADSLKYKAACFRIVRLRGCHGFACDDRENAFPHPSGRLPADSALRHLCVSSLGDTVRHGYDTSKSG